MKKLLLAATLCIGLARIMTAQSNIVNEASQLEQQGRFKEASAVLQKAIDAQHSPSVERKKLEWELDRIARIKNDYAWTRDQMFSNLKDSVRDLTREEFDGWYKQGWFDHREIDGTDYFFTSGVNNLYFRHPELNARRMDAKDERAKEKHFYDTVAAIKKAALAEKTPYVLPKTLRVNMDVTADADAAPAGDIMRAWVPIPRRYPFQYDFKLLSSSVKPKAIDSEGSAIRSIYFEQPAVGGKETDFQFDYEFTIRGVYFDLVAKIQPYNPDDEAVKKFTGESPHVVFTPDIKELSAKIVGNETNPMLKAKKIYDWLSGHLLYSYALEYSTIRNISEYCRANGYGDCGQQALLFITLCRYNGVPARWQSGWNLTPDATTIHDWSEIYLAPYGWMPVDPYMGNYAMRYIKSLTPDQKKEIRDFYFGGLDQYRMIANSDHSQVLNPPKDSMRSDDVDFQRGELEHNGKNIYFNQYSYSLKYKVLPPPALP